MKSTESIRPCISLIEILTIGKVYGPTALLHITSNTGRNVK